MVPIARLASSFIAFFVCYIMFKKQSLERRMRRRRQNNNRPINLPQGNNILHILQVHHLTLNFIIYNNYINTIVIYNIHTYIRECSRVGMHCSTHQTKLPINFFTNPTSGGSLWRFTCIKHQIWSLPSLFWPLFHSGSQFLTPMKNHLSLRFIHYTNNNHFHHPTGFLGIYWSTLQKKEVKMTQIFWVIASATPVTHCSGYNTPTKWWVKMTISN